MADYGAYCSVGRLKGDARIGSAMAASADAALLRALESASQHWNDECGRHFYPVVRTRYLDGPAAHVDRWQLWLPADLLTVTSIKLDLDGDRTYETTLSGSDYELVALRPDGTGPYVRVDLKPQGSRATWPTGRRSIEIVGTWGWGTETEAVGTLAAGLDASATAVTMTAGHGLTGGELLVIDSEDLYVQLVTVNALTVVRGANGSTAATHSSAAAVRMRRFPRPIEQATALRAIRLWRAGQNGFASEAGAPEMGGYAVDTSARDELMLVRDYMTRAY